MLRCLAGGHPVLRKKQTGHLTRRATNQHGSRRSPEPTRPPPGTRAHCRRHPYYNAILVPRSMISRQNAIAPDFGHDPARTLLGKTHAPRESNTTAQDNGVLPTREFAPDSTTTNDSNAPYSVLKYYSYLSQGAAGAAIPSAPVKGTVSAAGGSQVSKKSSRTPVAPMET